MIYNEEISNLLAKSYYQAASLDLDMHKMTDNLEAIRSISRETTDFKLIEDRLDYYLGDYLENDKEFEIIYCLRKNFRKQKWQGYKEQVDNIPIQDFNKRWNKWLRIFCYELSKLNFDTCDYLLKIKPPEQYKTDFRHIKKHLEKLSQDMWADGYPLLEYCIGQRIISKEVRADLKIIAGEIYLYHFFDYIKALEYFQSAQAIRPRIAKSERIFGEYYIEKKEFDRAKTHLQKALDIDSNDIDNYLILGDLYRSQNRPETAVGWYEEGLSKNPGKEDLYLRILLLHSNPSYFKKHHEEIEELLEKISKLDPRLTYLALNNAAYVYQRNKQYDKVDFYYKKAIELDPSRNRAYVNWGYTYLEKGDLDNSEKSFFRSIELDRNSFDAYWGLVALYRRRNDWEKVKKNLLKCEKLRPQWKAYIYNDFGNACEKLNEIKEARKYYLLALDNDPLKNLGLDSLLDIAENEQDCRAGIELLNKIYKIKGSSFKGDYHFRSGIICYKGGQYKKAIDHFLNAVEADPGDPEKWGNLGLAYKEDGNVVKAKENFRKAIRKSTDNKDRYYNQLGFYLTELQNYKEAISLFNRAIELDPDPVYLENLGFAYEHSGDIQNAEANYLKALEMEETEKDTYENRLGIFYFNQGIYDKSIQHYLNAIKIEPKAIYYENLGLSYQESNQLPEAEKYFRKAIEESTDNKDKYYNQLAFFLSGIGRHKEASKLLDKALEIKKAPTYYENLGYAYENLGRMEDAEKNYRKALRLSPHEKDKYYNRLGNFYFHQDNIDKAIGYYKKAIELKPEADYYENLGNLYNDLGKKDLFEDAILKAARLKPQDGKYYFHLGWNLLMAYEDARNARRYLKKAIKLYKKTPEIEREELMSFQFLGAAYQQEGDMEKAEQVFSDVLKLDPENDMVYSFLGKLNLDNNNYQQALDYYKQALELNRSEVSNYLNVAEVHKQMDNTEGAIEAYKEGAKVYPDLFEKIAEVYFEVGDYINAEKYIRKAMVAFPDNHLYLRYLGFIYQNQMKYDEAESTFQEAMGLAPPDEAEYYINLMGNLYAMKQDYKKARKYYEESLKMNPGEDIYLENLILILKMDGIQDEAVKILKTAVADQPDWVMALKELGNLLIEKGDYHQGIQYFEKIVDIDPEYNSAYNSLASAYLAMNRIDDAIEAYIEGANYDADLYERAARLYFNRGDLENAEKYIRKAVEADPKNPVYLGNLGIALQNQNLFKEAEVTFLQALDIAPDEDKGACYNYLGNLRLIQKDYKDAEEFYLKALDSNPESDVFLDNYIYMLKQSGQEEKALSFLVKLNEKEPTRIAALNNIGLLYKDAGKYEEAIPYFTKILATDPENLDVYINLGGVCAELGLLDEAINFYLSGAILDASCYDKAAEVYYHKGDFANAEKYIRMALEAYPNNHNYWKNLGLTLQGQNKDKEANAAFSRSEQLESH